MSDLNRQVLLVRRPDGMPAAEDFQIAEQPAAEPGEDQIRVALEYISLDPAMRGWMRDVRSYMPPVGLGEVMRAGGIGKVTASNSERFAVGDVVTGMLGVQEQAVVDAGAVFGVDPLLAPMPTYLGALGMTGMTAYFGLLDVGALKEGETVVVSGAAGAVGTVAGQIAKLKGCRAVGIAGGEAKCAMVVDELGFDACIDYKAGPVLQQLRELTPDRVDVYFDNVGGEILDAVLTRLARGARVVLCGAISQYNEDGMRGPANYMSLLVHRARMEGFLVFDYAARFGEAAREMAGWMEEGKLIAKEDVVPGGVEAFQPTLLRLFRGENVGKLVLAV
jgi:NADPH-dependent curcumin reductase CurA